MSRLRVSVVVPTLNAGSGLRALFDALKTQRPCPPAEIIVVDSGSTDGTVELAHAHGAVVETIESFSHGRSRNRGARRASGDLVVFMTQDAVPRDEQWLRVLVDVFDDPDVSAACSRQIPRDDASPMEQFFLKKRFGEQSEFKEIESLDGDVSYEQVIFSDVSSAVRRPVCIEFPFDETLVMGEDLKLARTLLLAGHTLAYVAESVVIHSHSYTLRQTFSRYFDSVVALSQIFPAQGFFQSVKIGITYSVEELLFVCREAPLWLFRLPFNFAAKSIAAVLAHFADALPTRLLKRISMHRYHWE